MQSIITEIHYFLSVSRSLRFNGDMIGQMNLITRNEAAGGTIVDDAKKSVYTSKCKCLAAFQQIRVHCFWLQAMYW